MTRMDGARRELHRLRQKLRAEDREFRSEAPPVDADGLPVWDGGEPLSLHGYERALDGDLPNADLTAEELEARDRLVPYREVFDRLARDATEKEAGT